MTTPTTAAQQDPIERVPEKVLRRACERLAERLGPGWDDAAATTNTAAGRSLRRLRSELCRRHTAAGLYGESTR